MATGPLDLNSWEEAGRQGAHARNASLEAALKALNERLAQGRSCSAANPGSDLPMVFIVGCARSGSTLLLQWLASTGLFCYPTNIISRFYADPYVGGLVHRVLHDLDDRGEVFPERREGSTFRSVLGRAKGAVEPHDFGYFWRHHFAFGATQAELQHRPDAAGEQRLVEDLRGLRAVFGRPLVMKALQMDWHLDILARLFPEAVFLHTERDPHDNALSLLKARRDYFGDEQHWYSFKPAEHAGIKDLPPMEQCLAQVHLTNAAVRASLARCEGARILKAGYEELCRTPAMLFDRLIGELGMEAPYQGPEHFPYSTDEDPDARGRSERFLATLR